MRKWINGKVVDMTEEEITLLQNDMARAEAEEAHRPFSESEVLSLLLRAQLNSMDIPDTVSVRMKAYYPDFEEIIGQTVKSGYKFCYNGELYKTTQPDLLIQAHYPPGIGTESLYVHIDENHVGNPYDPIPYTGNIILEAGKHYSQDGVMYLCNRNTDIAVYADLSELIGIYVQIADS